MIANPQAIADQGMSALRRGDARAARAAFERIEAAGQGSHQLRLLLAQACTLLDDRAAAHRVLDRVIADEPTNLYALIMRGDLLTRDQDLRAAGSWYQAALTQAARAGPLPPDLIDALRRAETAVRAAGATFQSHLDDHLAAAGISAAEAGPHFSEALDILAGRVQVQLQQPSSFYYPGLAQRTFFAREDFSWAEEMEAAAPAIRSELAAILAEDDTLVPYVAAEENRPAKRHPLLGDPSWSAFHFYRGGEPVPGAADRCPATVAALNLAPIPRIKGRSPMALFSVLRAGTHIPPHTGMINTRLICHLPLIVPSGCRLRVGNHIRAVEPDRLMVFDDSIEHEAFNDSDATRVVLLFEIWRPDISEAERRALTALYEAISLYAPAAEDQAGA
jgi:aspartyl/asparaginyl beta-hydroxylase (cupin superfamily)